MHLGGIENQCLEKINPCLRERGKSRSRAGPARPLHLKMLLVLSQMPKEVQIPPKVLQTALRKEEFCLTPPGDDQTQGTLTLQAFRILIQISGKLREPGEGHQLNSEERQRGHQALLEESFPLLHISAISELPSFGIEL